MSDRPEEEPDLERDVVEVRPTAVIPAREVGAFAATLPIWQQHLVGCLLAEGAVAATNMETAYSLLLADHGLLEGDPPHGRAIRDTQTPSPSSKRLVLQAIGPVVDVNRLAPEQVLPFATDGLTVVYGENATGKSGFVRLIKAMAGLARSDDRLLPDVLTRTGAATPGARLNYRTGDTDSQVDWHGGDDAIEDLQGVYVFDSSLAPIFANQERVIEFLPAGLGVLGDLADLMIAFVSRLDGESTQLRRTLSPISIDQVHTSAARLVSRLEEGAALPTPDELTSGATWSEKDEAALNDAKTRLDLEPTKAAVRTERLATAVGNIATRLRTIGDLLGDRPMEELAALRAQAAEARATASAVQDLMAREVSVLPGVGSEPWRQMFLHARDYALVAYGSRALPPDPPHVRCPLCQQTLEQDSRARLAHFSEYIEGQAEGLARQLETQLAGAIEHGMNLPIASAQDVEAVATVVEPVLLAAMPDLAIAAETFELAARRQRALAAPTQTENEKAILWPEGISDRLDGHARALRSIAASQRDLADETKRHALQVAYDELVARRGLSQLLPAATKRLELLGRLDRIARARRACDTSAVSRKNSELRRAFLTADFENRLRQEFATLGLGHLPLKSASRSQAGHSVVSIELDTPWSIENAEVLSDGEMRALALACFFADAQRIAGLPPLVLDDPVSSLDHERIERVAQRVVSEARKGRQMIVFTHSLVFFHELWVQASEGRVPMSTHWLTTLLSIPGQVRTSERPWEAQDVKPRLNELERRLAQAKRIDDHTSDEYRSAVSHFYTGLRETWERLVEEQLLGSVVERFRLGVETRRLSVVEVTSDDYAKVYFAMSRASQFSGHDRPVARQLAAPTPDEMTRDIREIREYSRELRSRHERVDRERRARHAPPDGQLEVGA